MTLQEEVVAIAEVTSQCATFPLIPIFLLC